MFTLCSDAQCSEAIRQFEGGSFEIGTSDSELSAFLPVNNSTTKLYLKETTPPEGYKNSEKVYELSISMSSEIKLEDDVFVTVTTYAMSIEGETSLNVVNPKDDTDTNTDVVTDTDTDTDSETDTDTESPTDTDSDPDSGTDTEPDSNTDGDTDSESDTPTDTDTDTESDTTDTETESDSEDTESDTETETESDTTDTETESDSEDTSTDTETESDTTDTETESDSEDTSTDTETETESDTTDTETESDSEDTDSDTERTKISHSDTETDKDTSTEIGRRVIVSSQPSTPSAAPVPEIDTNPTRTGDCRPVEFGFIILSISFAAIIVMIKNKKKNKKRVE